MENFTFGKCRFSVDIQRVFKSYKDSSNILGLILKMCEDIRNKTVGVEKIRFRISNSIYFIAMMSVKFL